MGDVLVVFWFQIQSILFSCRLPWRA